MSRSQLEAFRSMTVQERWKLQVELMNAAWEEMETLAPEELTRRMDYLNRTHEEGNRRILERFRSLKHGSSPSLHRS